MKAIPKFSIGFAVLVLVLVLVAMFALSAPVQASSAASVEASPKMCPVGECEPVFGWVDVPKVSKDHWVCPSGFQDNGSNCKKWVRHHWEYANKINVPILSCPGGSQPHGDGCRKWAQIDWTCNCGPGTHPDGNGHCVNDPAPKCTIPGLEDLDATDPNCKPPVMCEWNPEIPATDPNCKPPVMCLWNPLVEAVDPMCVKPKAPPEPPPPPHLVACMGCDDDDKPNYTRAENLPAINEFTESYTLTAKCSDSGFNKATMTSDYWTWPKVGTLGHIDGWTLKGFEDLGLKECNLAAHQWIEYRSLEEISVKAGNVWYNTRQNGNGPFVVTIPPGPARDQMYVVRGHVTGDFSWDQWNKLGLITAEMDKMKRRPILECGGFLYTDSDVLPGNVVNEKTGSNSSQFVQYLMSD